MDYPWFFVVVSLVAKKNVYRLTANSAHLFLEPNERGKRYLPARALESTYNLGYNLSNLGYNLANPTSNLSNYYRC